jgi:hypothetical protein
MCSDPILMADERGAANDRDGIRTKYDLIKLKRLANAGKGTVLK